LALRVSGSFQSELDILGVNVASNGRLLRLADIAEVRRIYADPPQPMFRVNGKPAIGVAIAMREGGDILALGQNIRRTMDGVTAFLPVGIEPVLGADQSVVVRSASGEFTTSLWQAIAIIMGGERSEPGRACRRPCRAFDPADARDGISDHGV